MNKTASASDQPAKCILCGKNIEAYNSEFNQLEISSTNKVNICADCIQKFVDWQQKVFTKLFPTTKAKKWVGRKNT